MPLIKIDELDLTSPGVLAQETDVVYIPGFVDTKQTSLNTADGYVGLEPFKPTYFSNVKAFVSLCGEHGAKFETTQKYTDLIVKNPDGTYSGFDGKAVPDHRVMFYNGDIDPSYVMAKELLNAGLAVVYERINKDPDYVELENEPEDWDTNYFNYFKNKEIFETIANPTAPEVFKKHFAGETGNVTNDYYEVDDSNNDDTIVVYKKADNSTLLNANNEFLRVCYSYDGEIYAKFKHPTFASDFSPKFETITQEVEGQDVEVAKFCLINVTEVELTEQSYEDEKYFKSTINGQYVLAGPYEQDTKYFTILNTPLFEQPEGWGDDDSNFYQIVYNDAKILEYHKVRFSNGLVWAPDTYYNKVDDYFELFTEEPLILTPDSVFVKDVVPTISGTSYQMPSDWIMSFGNYYKASEMKVNVVGITTEDNYVAAPEFEENTFFKFDNFINVAKAYEGLAKVFDASRDQGIADMGSVNIKYLTSGGYPTYEYNDGALVNAIKSVAVKRGDCVAFIDHTNNPYRTTNVNLPDSLYATVLSDDSIAVNGEFATMFTPYMNYTRVTTDKNADGKESPTGVQLSATFGYLLALADSLKTNPSWLAVAGATRGQVPNLQQVATYTPITNGTADAMQPRDAVSVNAITEIIPYGQTIWGNRTLKNNATEGNLTATSFLNIRHMVSDIKKVCYSTARALTFEQNNDILWINFKSKISPTLDKMLSGYGISGYKIVRDLEHEKAAEKATLCAKIIIYPTYAVEDFYITIVLTDEEIGVSE